MVEAAEDRSATAEGRGHGNRWLDRRPIGNPRPADHVLIGQSAFAAIEAWLFWGLLALMAAMVVVAGPILTNDGPAHLSMASFLRLAGEPSAPMLNRLYEPNPAMAPNALGHYLLAGFLWLLPPLRAEQALQVVILAGIPLAARLALRRIRQDAAWLALFFFPVALQRLFFAGLYNFCLSLIGFLLCVWAYLRLREAVLQAGPGRAGAPPPTRLRQIEASVPARTAQLAALSLLTLASHISGWMAAALALGTMVLVETAMRLRGGEARIGALRLGAVIALALLPALVLAGLFMLQASGQTMAYGAHPLERILRIARGDAFAPIGRSTALAGAVLVGMLLALAMVGVRRALQATQVATTQRLQAAVCAVPLAFLLLLLVTPEQAGGGWTHVWRAEVFPQMGLALACAALPIGSPAALRLLMASAAAVGGVVSIATTTWVQLIDLPPVAAEFAEADALVGAHCIVAPVIGTVQLDARNTARISHQPLLHIASRFELRQDRPVLYNYLVRLTVYPVRYRAGMEPAQTLFGWQPQSRTTRIATLDIPAFEATSTMQVDYVLAWDLGPEDGLRAALPGPDALAHRSASGRLELYRSSPPGECRGP